MSSFAERKAIMDLQNTVLFLDTFQARNSRCRQQNFSKSFRGSVRGNVM